MPDPARHIPGTVMDQAEITVQQLGPGIGVAGRRVPLPEHVGDGSHTSLSDGKAAGTMKASVGK